MAENDQQFDTFQQWVSKASSWLTRHPSDQAICFDTKGRRCANGADMHRARDEDAFPVRWLWSDQIPELLAVKSELLEALKNAVEMVKALPVEAFGIADDGHGTTWPLRDEYLHSMNLAIAKAEGAS